MGIESVSHLNDFFRLKVKELNAQFEQAKALIVNHNLSVGLILEEILREFLREVLPGRFGITQGFIAMGATLSRQCDIIIYNCVDYAPLYSAGDIKIVPSESVAAVIEVKSSIDSKRFIETIKAFDTLTCMGIRDKYLFVFSSPQAKYIISWLYKYDFKNRCKMISHNDDSYIVSDSCHLDVGDLEVIPKGIVSLEKEMFLSLSHCQDDKNDYWGYVEYEVTDMAEKRVSCLQQFLTSLQDAIIEVKHTELFIPYDNIKEGDDINDMRDLKIKNSFPLVPF